MSVSQAPAREQVGIERGVRNLTGADESAATDSGYDVPAGFMGLVDVLMLIVMCVVAWQMLPAIQWISAAERLGRLPWLSWLQLPPESAARVPQSFREIAWIPLVTIPATLLALHAMGGYRPVLAQSRTRLWLASAIAPIFGASVLSLIIIAVRNQHTSRALIFSFSILSGAGLLVCRKAVRYYKARRLRAGHYARNVLVIAPSRSRDWIARHFAAHVSPAFYRLYGYLDIPAESAASAPAASTSRAHGPGVLGRVEDLGELLIRQPVHDVVAIHGAGDETWLHKAIEHCEYFQVVFRLVPEALVGDGAREWPAAFGRGPLGLPEIVIRPGSLGADALFVKRIFDIVVSAALLVLLSPLFLLIAIAIKLTTPGLPIFYPWRVVGYKGRPFTGYKFTTMYADADQRMEELRHLNEMQGPVFKMRADPRVTPLGRLLRKFSLNELPQLWSVLKGDMSLVGPRPAYPNELARYELWHKRKLCVQPGITCLWQVRGRNRINSFDDWVRMDFEYIDNWSLWLDCRILIRTVWAVVGGTGL